jgi:hypothetical protein
VQVLIIKQGKRQRNTLIRKYTKSKALIEIEEKGAMQNVANETGTTKTEKYFDKETEKCGAT